MTEQKRIVRLLKAGLEAVEEAEVPSELKPIAYRHALEVLGGTASMPTPEAPRPSEDAGGETALLTAIAKRLKLDLDVVTHVFEEEGDQVHLIVTRAKLPNGNSKAASMRDVALLVTAGRQAAAIEDYTAAALVRQECEELGVLDGPNFSTELGRLGMRARGGPKSKEVHASRHQLEQAAELVSQIARGDEK